MTARWRSPPESSLSRGLPGDSRSSRWSTATAIRSSSSVDWRGGVRGVACDRAARSRRPRSRPGSPGPGEPARGDELVHDVGHRRRCADHRSDHTAGMCVCSPATDPEQRCLPGAVGADDRRPTPPRLTSRLDIVDDAVDRRARPRARRSCSPVPVVVRRSQVDPPSPQDPQEERGADEGRDHPDRQLGRIGDDPGQQIGQREERRTEQEVRAGSRCDSMTRPSLGSRGAPPVR